MIKIIIMLLVILPTYSWAGCDEINNAAEVKQAIVPSDESGYKVTNKGRTYFYSAPDVNCKIDGVFIIHGDSVNVYAEYNGFSSVIFFKKDGSSVDGWIHSNAISATGTGIGPGSS